MLGMSNIHTVRMLTCKRTLEHLEMVAIQVSLNHREVQSRSASTTTFPIDSTILLKRKNLCPSTKRHFQTSTARFDVTVPPFPNLLPEADVEFKTEKGSHIIEDDGLLEIGLDKSYISKHSSEIKTTVHSSDGYGVEVEDLPRLNLTDAVSFENTFQRSSTLPSFPLVAVSPQMSTVPPTTGSRPLTSLSALPKQLPSKNAASMSSKTTASPGFGTATVKIPPQDPTKEISGTRSDHRIKMSKMRLKIAQRLKDAQNNNAMLTTLNEIDMYPISQFRKINLDAFQKQYGIKLGFMSAFVKAVAYALQDQPIVNSVIDGTDIVYRNYIDISIAIAAPKGLVVPVVRNVEKMSYAEIELEIAALGEKAKKGTLTVEAMDGGTFTISNGGIFGSLLGMPIINPPQSAILGMHRTKERPCVVNGKIVIRPMMYVALSYDHRLIDGREAVLFLRKIKAAVEDPRIILAGL